MRAKLMKRYFKTVSITIIISLFLLCFHQTFGKNSNLLAAELSLSARKIVTLSDNWRFQLDMKNIGEKERWFADDFDRSAWTNVKVPQAWDCYETALWGFEGTGWYSITIRPDDFISGKRAEIIFNRAMYYSKVWLNGEYLGENIGGYLPFNFDITKHLKPGRDNDLVMRVNNVPKIEWLPAAKQIEWIQYGGIIQKVQLVSTSHTYIDNFIIRTTPENEGARISCIANIVNGTNAESETELNVEIARDVAIKTGSIRVRCKPNDSVKVNLDILIDRAVLWSPDTPVLYTATISLKENGVVIDDLTERFGIRTIRAEGTSILLNGKPIIIKGVNRYDEYGRFGPNVPEEILRKELTLMKSVGINTIRVHYPQFPELLSLYDEYGFMMMEEVALNWWGRDNWGKVDQTLNILPQAKSELTKMIRRDKNHPCIIIWSMANECQTDNEVGITVMRELIKQAKSLDPTRLVTFTVSYDPKGHLAFNDADIVCVNKYNGLGGKNSCSHITDIDSLGCKSFAEELTLHRVVAGNKPLLLTEFGCQSIKGIRGDVYFSEEFQSAYIEKIWNVIRNTSGVAGGILWSWADYYHRKYFTNYAVFGPYGVVTVDRQPKKALEALARMYGEKIKE